MIISIKIKNIFDICEAQVKLHPLTLLVGSDPAGTTQFMEIFLLLAGKEGKGNPKAGFDFTDLGFAPNRGGWRDGQELRLFTDGATPPFYVYHARRGIRESVCSIATRLPRNTILLADDIAGDSHPRTFQWAYENLKMIAREKGLTIIGVTQNPYFVDQFRGDEAAVLVVDGGKAGVALTPLSERLEGLELWPEDSLGAIWYSGLVGGVP